MFQVKTHLSSPENICLHSRVKVFFFFFYFMKENVDNYARILSVNSECHNFDPCDVNALHMQVVS